MTAGADDKTVRDLEWELLVEKVARYALSPQAAATLRALRPLSTRAEALDAAAAAAQAMDLLAGGDPIPARAVSDTSDLLERLERGSVASAVELRRLAEQLGVAEELRAFATPRRTSHPTVAARLDSPATLDELAKLLETAIAPDGEIQEAASSELKRARDKVRDTRGQLKRKLGQLMKRYEGALRERFYTEREGRYVLPVRADAPFRVEGTVFGSSASGGTLYIEPQELSPLSNQLQVALAEVERQEARVLARLSREAQTRIDELEKARAACLAADVLAAVARFGAATRARVVSPSAEPRISVLGMRHPLLIDETTTVVPNDIAIESGRGLVISGPNAGGKTVALKCLGLAAWMARVGLPVPVEPKSEIGWFDSVLTDVGDEQSLSRSLSTFSAHMARLSGYLDRAGSTTLVLLDEVAAGTDPEEGSALAVASLEEFVARGAAVAVTTHYERVKGLATHDTRFENAAVGFDIEAMRPTFRLTMKTVGASAALTVAERYGIPKAIVRRAEELMPRDLVERERLLADLEADRDRLDAARRLAQAEAEQQARLRAELEAEREHVREQERARLAREGSHLMSSVREARSQIRRAQEQLKSDPTDRRTVRQAERLVNQAARAVTVGTPLAETARGRAPSPVETPPKAEEITRGAEVYVPHLGTKAQVLEAPQRGTVRVAAGPLKLTVRLDQLLRAPSRGGASSSATTTERGSPKARRRADSEPPAAGEQPPLRTSANTCDIRGLRVDESRDRVELFIDRMLAEGESIGFVLHGHGTGALRSSTRQQLIDSPFVERAEPAAYDAGGDAVTVFWLKS